MFGTRSKLLKILGFFLISVPAAAAPQIADSKLNLQQALEAAFLHSPDLLAAKNSLEASQFEKKNAFVYFLPSLDLSASHGYRGFDPDTANATALTPILSSASLSLTENIYDNGESSKKYQIAKLNNVLAEIEYKKTKAKIIQSVLLAYYRNNISIHNLRFTVKNYDELERLAKLVGAQYHQGLKTRKDYLSFKTKAQRGRLGVINAEQELTSARSELLATIGLDSGSVVQFDESVLPVLPKNKLDFNIETETLYDAQILNIQKQLGQLKVDLAKRKYWPELNLIGEASYGSSQYFGNNESWIDNESTQWSILLNLKFNILDWGVRNRNVQIALASENAAQQNYRSQLLTVLKELEIFKVKAERASESYRLAKELQKMEEDTFKLLERDYRSGHATYLELSTGLANLLDAQGRGEEAEYDLAELYLQWKYYKGMLSEENLSE